MGKSVAYILAALAVFAAPVSAQPADAPSTPDFASYRPSVAAVRIDHADRPGIDGDLSDAVWARATPIEEFYQVEPVAGATPSQKTTVYVLYDEKNLYFGVRLHDDAPDRIVRNLLERDVDLQDEDAIRILIDPFGTFRDGYFFGTNANGARVDALLENNSNYRGEWDTVFTVKTAVDETGWTAEFEIPLQSLSFSPGRDAWNLQIVRTIRRNNEEVRWANIDRTRGRTDLASTGALTGLSDARPGAGFEVRAYATAGVSRNWETGETFTRFDPSGDAFYKITPALTGTLTVNTDFSDAPLDARQVNTGRFSLFFPETRDFFLQDAQSFEFGGRTFSNPNGMPFFSRRIGIVSGAPVDLIAGAKLSGRAGPANIGALAARAGSAPGVDEQMLSAVRVSTPVLGESKIGVIATHGDPEGDATNSVVGADFQYFNSTSLPGRLFADFAYLRSFDDDGTGGVSDDMFAFEGAYRGQKWNWNLRLAEIGADYRPRMGFINRPGIRRFNVGGWRAYRPVASYIRYAETGLFTTVITDLDGAVQDRVHGGWLFAQNNEGDEANIEIVPYRFERVPDAFDIAGVLPVPAGDYEYASLELRLATTNARVISAAFEFDTRDVYDGRVNEYELSLGFRPDKRLRLSAAYGLTRFRLPTGALDIHVAEISAAIVFTPMMSLRADLQYDNISEDFTFLGRFLWEPKAGQEVFVSLGHAATIEEERFPTQFRSQSTGFAVRLGNTFRF